MSTTPRMTKKRKLEILEKRFELQSSLTQTLLFSLGWDIDPRGYIIDQDTFTRIQYRRKTLKCIADPSSTIPVIHNAEIVFDPYTNKGLSEKIFAMFLEKEQKDNDIYVKMYYLSTDGIKSKCNVQIENKDKSTGLIESEYFITPNFAYLDIILGMSGYNMTQTLLDLEESMITYDI